MPTLVDEIFAELCRVRLVDPHSHINPHRPAAESLNDILAYHYYTELAHSAGLPRKRIEESTGLEQARRIVEFLDRCSNTVQVSWLLELSKTFFGFDDPSLTTGNIDRLHDAARQRLGEPNWVDEVFRATNLESIFLTNDFDDPLEGFNTDRYVPCLRTDDLVFKLHLPATRDRFARSTGRSIERFEDVEAGLDRLFERFVARGARAAAISLPPDFAPQRPTDVATRQALDRVLRGNEDRTLSYALFLALAERCQRHHLPFDLMIGVWRDVYPAGVHQGRDLYDKTTSLHAFRELFNAFPDVTFPISVLTHNQNQELTSYAWIFPNVVTLGHWWYSNVPAFIEPDLRARLEAVPWSKQIGYYSDAYKLEFVLPKYNMYRRVLASVLASQFIEARGWPIERAIDLGQKILRGNVERIFPASR